MRRINTISQKNKKNRTTQFIVGGLLIFVMFFSVFGYGFYNQRNNSNTNKINYNGFEFTNQNNRWVVSVENLDFIFRNNPEQVQKIDSKLNFLNSYSEQPLYIYSENKESELEIYSNMQQVTQRIQSACLESQENCNKNWPIKTCENNFIIIKIKNKSEIIQKNNCVFINGPKENITQITDEFLFKIIGIEQ